MSLRPEPIGAIPAETARVARAAFPKGTLVMRLRDESRALYEDEDFAAFYSTRGQPGLAPWRLALVTVLQFLEHLSDRQAADAVRARIDWKYALGLELTDPGFHFSVLADFRARLVAGWAEHLLLDRMLERFKARGLVKARGKQRTDSTHVLAAVHDLHLLELVAETLRATLDDLATVAPDWLRDVVRPRHLYLGHPYRTTAGTPYDARIYAVHWPDGAVTAILGGQAAVGGMLSVTVTTKLQVFVLPAPSVARHVTTVLPLGKFVPLAGPPTFTITGAGVQSSVADTV